MKEAKVPRNRDLRHISLAPRDVCNVTLSFYGDNAAAIFELQELNNFTRSEVISRLTVLGLQSLGYCLNEQEVSDDGC